jgi:actin related protein 2/3 complex subunit 2
VEEHLRSVYGQMLVAPREGASATVELDVKSPPLPPAQLATKVANLRRHAMAAPFHRAFAAVTAGAGAKTPPVTVRFRANEPIFILPRADRVSVIYALEFSDVTDRAVARVVAQEFVEAQRLISAAPPAAFAEPDREPPLELRGLGAVPRQTENFVGYLSFAIFPRHFDTEVRRENAINLLTGFRMYLHYHLKAAKAYLHARMRGRVDGWLQVLNRAVPEDPYAAREKKLASGKTFVRKP